MAAGGGHMPSGAVGEVAMRIILDEEDWMPADVAARLKELQK